MSKLYRIMLINLIQYFDSLVTRGTTNIQHIFFAMNDDLLCVCAESEASL
jgi:hypothetical protein